MVALESKQGGSVMAFEEEFGLEIPDDEAEKLQTVGDALNYMKQKKG